MNQRSDLEKTGSITVKREVQLNTSKTVKPKKEQEKIIKAIYSANAVKSEKGEMMY